MKHLLLLFFTSTFFFSAQASQHTIRWKINHSPTPYFQQTVNEFNRILKDEGAAEIEVKAIYPETLNSNKEFYVSRGMVASVKNGTFEMAQVYTSEIAKHINSDFGLFELPFLFKNHEHADKVFDGPTGKRLLASLDNSGVKGLGFTYSGGFVEFLSFGKILTTSTDLAQASIKYIGGSVSDRFYKKMKSMSHPLITFEKGDSGYTKFDFNSNYDLFAVTYSELEGLAADSKKQILMSDIGHQLLATTLIINENFYKSLSPRLQKVLTKASRKLAKFERDLIVKSGKSVKKKLASQGARFHKLSNTERIKMKNKSTDVYLEFLKNNKTARASVEEIQTLQ